MLKSLIYDWQGLNEQIFYVIYKFANSFSGFMNFLVIFTESAHYKNIFFLINLVLIINFIMIKREEKFFKKEVYVRYFIVPYFQKLLFIFLAYFTTLGLVFIIKKIFIYQRPICLGLVEINYIEKGFHTVREFFTKRCSNDGSFPSAHAAISAIVALYCLELSDKFYLKLMLIIYMILIAISRIALGLHYPMDIFSGLLIGFFAYISCVYLCEWINKKYYNQMKFISEKFLTL